MNKHARGGFIGRMRGPGFAEIGGSVNRTARSVERKSFRRKGSPAKQRGFARQSEAGTIARGRLGLETAPVRSVWTRPRRRRRCSTGPRWRSATFEPSSPRVGCDDPTTVQPPRLREGTEARRRGLRTARGERPESHRG
eukprot:7327887-Pyramimonas_sp.AAC.1